MLLDHLLRLLKFGLVGLLGMVVDFSVTWFFKEKMRINRFVANGLGFCCAVVLNFLLNRIWTFSSRVPNLEGQLIRFIGVSLVGLVINTALVYFLNKRKLNFYLSKAIAIVIVFFWNYSANAFFTFRK